LEKLSRPSFEKQTSAILEFFRLQLRPYQNNRRTILHQTTKFHPNRTTRGDDMISYWFRRWQPRRRNTTSGFVFDDVTLFWRSTFIGKPHFSSHILLNPRLRYNYFRSRITAVRHIGILLPVLVLSLTISPYSHVTLHQAAEFRPNRPILSGDIMLYRFSRWYSHGGAILLQVSCLMVLLSSESPRLSKKQISSRYFNPRLRYNYFRFGKTTVRHIGILPPVSISTISS